jgi:hypothetical protein
MHTDKAGSAVLDSGYQGGQFRCAGMLTGPMEPKRRRVQGGHNAADAEVSQRRRGIAVVERQAGAADAPSISAAALRTPRFLYVGQARLELRTRRGTVSRFDRGDDG